MTLKEENVKIKERILQIESRDAIPGVATSIDRTFPNGAPAKTYEDVRNYIETEIVLNEITDTVLHFEWPDLIIIVQCSTNYFITGETRYKSYDIPIVLNSITPIPIEIRYRPPGSTDLDFIRYSYRTQSPSSPPDADVSGDDIEIQTLLNTLTIGGGGAGAQGQYYKAYFFSKVPGITYDENVIWPTTTPYSSVYQPASISIAARKSYAKAVKDIIEENEQLYTYDWDDLAI